MIFLPTCSKTTRRAGRPSSTSTAVVWRTLVSPLVAMCLASFGCPEGVSVPFDGSAVIEAQTYQVGPAIQGQIVAMHAGEGDAVDSGGLIALLDTVPLQLRLDEVQASAAELQRQVAAHRAHVEAAKAEVRGLKRELDRIRPLVDNGSVPSQQKDQLETKYETAQFRQKAAAASLSAVAAKRHTLAAKRAQVEEQLGRCRVSAPVSGMVLTRYRSRGEFAGPAAPLFEIASYDTVWADFFVPQPLLGEVSVGRTVYIRVDTPDDEPSAAFVPAEITWVSDEAEFAPKNIQTREARNELVFRVRAQAANTERILKRGLPVEVWRRAPDDTSAGS